jgi:hypothetical protein
MFATLALAVLQLPATSDKAPVAIDHFPTPVHAFVWRNWQLVPTARMAEVIGATEDDVARMGAAMGLGTPPSIDPEVRKRGYITIIRRNWHLLPYEQLTALLGMTEAQLAFTLREDDFLYIKLGSLKPQCPPLVYSAPDEAVRAREAGMRAAVEAAFPEGPVGMKDPLFQFVADLSQPVEPRPKPVESLFSPRYCSSYFALFGDPLLEEDINPYPDGYLDRLVASGADGVWMHIVLYQLVPFPWEPSLSDQHEKRLERLRELTEQLDARGIGLYLYLNEPRAMPLSFFDGREGLRGVTAGDHATMCTSVPEVRAYLVDSVAAVCKAAPKLRGFFTITASENLTNCWSHHNGGSCPKCRERTPAEVIADVNRAVAEGIAAAGTPTRLIAWDWGWQDAWALDAIAQLPEEAALMSVSEWSIPIERGGMKSEVGEYSISVIGPGPRAARHWEAARARGLQTIAKIQAGNTWELAAVPYIPAVANVAQHAANLRGAGVNGIMLGWSLGGYPSPNLEAVAAMGRPGEETPTVDGVLEEVATGRYGATAAPHVVRAWKSASDAFKEFPYSGAVVYNAPLQVGPANPLYPESTGYASAMVGIPYDHLDGWRGHYPPEVFQEQLGLVAAGFEEAFATLADALGRSPATALQRELDVMEAAALHFGSVSRQARFVLRRGELAEAQEAEARAGIIAELETLLREERAAAIRLHTLQTRDSRLGYESSNHYFYIPADLAEKVLNCDFLLEHWLPTLRADS